MRLSPPVGVDEALAYLSSQAMSAWGLEASPELTEILTPMAEAMAAVSALSLPDECEPLFL